MERNKFAEKLPYIHDTEISSVEDELSRIDEILSVLQVPLKTIQDISERKKYSFGWQPKFP